MRPLYEIDKVILQCVDLETGEILDEEKLNGLSMEREKKIEGVILWCKDLRAEAEAVKAEGKKLYDRANSIEKTLEQLKKWASFALDGEKFKTERCSVSYRKSSSIIIDNPSAVSLEYFKEVKEDWISKSAIKDAIEAGKEVKGAHQEEKQSIIIK